MICFVVNLVVRISDVILAMLVLLRQIVFAHN